MERGKMKDKNAELLSLYLKELEYIKPLTEDEEKELISRHLKGDKACRDRLIEGNLKQALSYMKNYIGQGLSTRDLISEINLALTKAVDSFGGGDFRKHIETEISAAIELAANEEISLKNSERELEERLNGLAETSRLLALELGREADREELAARMKIDIEELDAMMKLTMDAMK